MMLLRALVLGELSLDGAIQPVSGVLPAAIIAPPSLTGLLNHIHGRQVLTPPIPQIQSLRTDLPDLVDLKGQDTARRVLEIAAMNPCRCGYLGDPGRACSCAPSKLSGKDFGPDDGSF